MTWRDDSCSGWSRTVRPHALLGLLQAAWWLNFDAPFEAGGPTWTQIMAARAYLAQGGYLENRFFSFSTTQRRAVR